MTEHAWQCATCAETNPAERDPARPDFCRSCPETWCTLTRTTRNIVITAYRDGTVVSRLPYSLSPAGERSAARRVVVLAAQGYPLR